MFRGSKRDRGNDTGYARSPEEMQMFVFYFSNFYPHYPFRPLVQGNLSIKSITYITTNTNFIVQIRTISTYTINIHKHT